MRVDVKHIMRFIIVFLLFQFVSPALFSIVTLVAVPCNNKSVIAPSHNSIIVPLFLKEQEERDHEAIIIKLVELTPLIDFSNHSFTHTAAQSLRFKGNHSGRFIYSPSIFAFNCTFLI